MRILKSASLMIVGSCIQSFSKSGYETTAVAILLTLSLCSCSIGGSYYRHEATTEFKARHHSWGLGMSADTPVMPHIGPFQGFNVSLTGAAILVPSAYKESDNYSSQLEYSILTIRVLPFRKGRFYPFLGMGVGNYKYRYKYDELFAKSNMQGMLIYVPFYKTVERAKYRPHYTAGVYIVPHPDFRLGALQLALVYHDVGMKKLRTHFCGVELRFALCAFFTLDPLPDDFR